jgi:hypothetical protein
MLLRFMLPGLIMLASTAPVGAETLAICHIGGPGSTRQAQPVLDKFLRHVEQAAGLKKGSMTGEYHTTEKDCLEYIKKTKPLFAVLDLATYLQEQRDLRLVPLAAMGGVDKVKYRLLVREGSYKSLDQLKGKTLISNHLDNPRFVSRIIFGGKLDVKKHFTLKDTRRPLKGIRRVARERADATLVNSMAYDHLDQLRLDVKLEPLFTSRALPGLTLAVVGGRKAKRRPMVTSMVKALPRLCSGPGKSLCQTFQVSSFEPVKGNIYRKLARQYRGK